MNALRTEGFLTDSYQITLDIEGFEYSVDKSIETGGNNTGTSPHGLLLGSIASCKLMVAKSYLDYNNISYKQVNIQAESQIKGKKHNETIEITVNIVVIGANLDEKEVGYMARIVEKGCTMANILTAGGENEIHTVIEVKP